MIHNLFSQFDEEVGASSQENKESNIIASVGREQTTFHNKSHANFSKSSAKQDTPTSPSKA